MPDVALQWLGARCAAIRISDGGLFHTKEKYRLTLNGKDAGETDRAITLLHGLVPATRYVLKVERAGATEDAMGRGGAEKEAFYKVRVPEDIRQDEVYAENGPQHENGAGVVAASCRTLAFETEEEFVTLNVRSFGAKGDGQTEDTAAIQAAILACPPKSRVLLPAGCYPVTHLFLKSGIRLEVARGAQLLGIPDRTKIPILPGMVETTDEEGEYNLGTWEGNPLPMYASLLTGVAVEDVHIYGEGVLDGRASEANWWREPKKKHGAWRPRMVLLNRCKDVTVAGVSVLNSPSWNIHPYFCRDVAFYGLRIRSDAGSPNTDGLNPESCTGVAVAGVHFSVGDDCIALKSGKQYMGDRYATPCSGVRISHCSMGDGHGAVTIGSEMSGGVRDVRVEACVFHDTDRGLRIKTRRGRGKNAIVDNIIFRNIHMERVKTPFTANAFYRCDPDGETDAVQSRAPMPLGEDTPQIRTLQFESITARECHVATAYFLGLPEQPIGEIAMKDVAVSFAEDAEAGEPVMSLGVEAVCRQGIMAVNVDKMRLENVRVEGAEGSPLVVKNVRELWVEGGNLS